MTDPYRNLSPFAHETSSVERRYQRRQIYRGLLHGYFLPTATLSYMTSSFIALLLKLTGEYIRIYGYDSQTKINVEKLLSFVSDV